VDALDWEVSTELELRPAPLALSDWNPAAVDFHCTDIDEQVAAAAGVPQVIIVIVIVTVVEG
jgi:hypothetical protein